MSWTNPASHIFATSEVVTASTMNTYIQANLTFLGIGYGARMHQATTQSIPNSTETLIHFDTIDFDPNGMCTTGTSAKITIPANAGGVYIVTWSGSIQNNGAFFIWVTLQHNGLDYASAQGSAAQQTHLFGSTLLSLVATDTLGVTIEHNFGSAQGTVGGSIISTPHLSCHLVAPN